MRGAGVVKRKRKKASILLDTDQMILLGFQGQAQEPHKDQEEDKKQSKEKNKHSKNIIGRTLNILRARIGTQQKRGILGPMETIKNMICSMNEIKEMRTIDQDMMGIGI